MAKAILFTPDWPFSASCLPVYPEPIGYSQIWSHWGNEHERSIPRRCPTGRTGISHLAQCLHFRVFIFRIVRRAAGAACARLRMNLLDWLVLVGAIVGIA